MENYTETIVSSLPLTLIEKAKSYFDGQDPAHDWYHNLRVMGLCERIGQAEKADMQVLRLAVLLHDIGRSEERRTGECHAEISAREACNLLRDLNYEDQLIRKIQQAILTHRFRKNNPPTTLEEKILFDADKLDSIGAVGVARAFAYSGVIGQPIQSDHPDQHTPVREYESKLRHLHERLFTATAKEIAEERHRFMEQFFVQWESEIRGAL